MAESPSDTQGDKKKNGLGWGAITAGLTVTATLLGGLGFFGDLIPDQHFQMNANAADNVRDFAQGKDTLGQLGENVEGLKNDVAGGISHALRGGGDGVKAVGGAVANGAQELHATLGGIGTDADYARKVVDDAIDVINQGSGIAQSDGIIKKFLESNAELMRYDDKHWLYRVGEDVLKVDERQLLAMDTRVGGGVFPNEKWLDGLNPQALESMQGDLKEALKLEQAQHDIGAKITRLGLGAGAGFLTAKIVDDASHNHDGVNNIMSQHAAGQAQMPGQPSTRMLSPKEQAHYFGMAMQAPQLNAAIETVRT